MEARINRLLESLSTADAVLLTSPVNMLYYSGFTGGTYCILLSKARRVLLTDSRYTIQAKQEAAGFEIICGGVQDLKKIIEDEHISTVAFEDTFMTVAALSQLKKALNIAFAPLGDTIVGLRAVKSKAEIAKIREAERLGDAAFAHILEYVRPGQSEIEIAGELEQFMRKAGASGTSFATIVASGPRSAMPHGEASSKIITRGEFLLFDFGCVLNGYCSDMTRTVHMGPPSDEAAALYRLVAEAQSAALVGLRPGMRGCEADALARSVIEAAGYGKQFGHSLGHGVGLEIHEEIRFSPKSQQIIEPGMVVTVEPGVYLEGFGGVRIEDVVAFDEAGFENLTTSPKELIIL